MDYYSNLQAAGIYIGRYVIFNEFGFCWTFVF